jgi:predicted ribosome quality control (RQC) complex YloA/Tae2 family protein
MNVDAQTLSAVADEFGRALIGARVDDIIQPTTHSIALQTYGSGRNRWLIASAHPQLARIHYVGQKPRKLAQDPPAFVMLLRKYLEGARVLQVRQPPWERLVEIGCSHGQSGRVVWLVVEIMGRLSNLILRDEDGLILGALRQVGADENRYRTIAPHVPYRYPPPQTRVLHGTIVPRLPPEQVTARDLETAGLEMHQAGPRPRGRKSAPLTVADVLMAQVAGFGHELSAEATFRALGTERSLLTSGVDWARVGGEVRALAEVGVTAPWQPTLVYSGSVPSAVGDHLPTGLAVYRPLRYTAGETLTPVESANDMLAIYFKDGEWRHAIERAKLDLHHLLQTHRGRSVRKQEALLEELSRLDERHHLREEADILLAFQQEVPAHASQFTRTNPFVTSSATTPALLTISLDPSLSAVENANRKYERYHKLQRAGAYIPAQLEASRMELARIEQLATDLAIAETPAEIALVRTEVVDAGYLRPGPERKRPASKQSRKGSKAGKKPPSPKHAAEGGTPLRRQSGDDFVLLVGKNSRQNEEVTFHQAGASDLWLHARGVPGAHVIIKSGGRPVSEATLREAAALAAYYSQSRSAGTVPVDITEQRYLRHLKGGGPGMVTYERERTIHVQPQDKWLE